MFEEIIQAFKDSFAISTSSSLENVSPLSETWVPSKLTSLPTEILLKILTFCSHRDMESLRYSTLSFAKACKLLPFISARELFCRLHKGEDPVPFLTTFMTDCPPIADYHRQIVFLSYENEMLEEFHGDMTPFLITFLELAHLSGQDVTTWSQLIDVLRTTSTRRLDIQQMDPGMKFWSMTYMPCSMFRVLCPHDHDIESDRMERSLRIFEIALKFSNYDNAVEFLDFILECIACGQDCWALQNTFDKHPKETLEFIFNKKPHRPTSAYLKYQSYYDTLSVKSLSSVITEAFKNGDLNLDLWYHQLLCIIYLSESPASFKQLIGNTKFDIPGLSYFAACYYCAPNPKNQEFVWALIKHPKMTFEDTNSGYFLSYSVSIDDIEMTRFLVRQPQIDISSQFFRAVKLAAISDRFDAFMMFINELNVDPTMEDNELCKVAAEGGALQVLRYLLGHPSVDPTADRNKPFKRAAQSGKIEAMKMLLEVPEVDPTVDENEPFKRAAEHGAINSMEYLVNELQIDPLVGGFEALQRAIVQDQLLAFKWLLDNTCIDPSLQNSLLVLTAVENESPRLECLKILLSDTRVDPSANNNRAFVFCFEATYPLRPFDQLDQPVVPALDYRTGATLTSHTEAGLILLRHPRVLEKLIETYPNIALHLRHSVFDLPEWN